MAGKNGSWKIPTFGNDNKAHFFGVGQPHENAMIKSGCGIGFNKKHVITSERSAKCKRCVEFAFGEDKT